MNHPPHPPPPRDARPSARTPGAWATRGVLVLALLGIGFSAVHKQTRDGNDFPIYWQAARDLWAGRSPYDVTSGLHGYVYLPWFALALGAFAWLPLPGAAWCMYALNVALAFVAVRTLSCALPQAGLARLPRVWFAASVPLLGLVHDNLVLGQANLALLALLAITLQAALEGTSLAGVALGFAAALKMPAGVLVLPFVRRRGGRTLLAFALTAATALLLPFVVGGPTRNMTLLRDWQAKVVAPAAAGTLQGSRTIDQSPHATLRRLLVDEPATGARYVNVAALDSTTFARASRAVALLLLAGYALVWFVAPASATPRALALDLALGACAMVQISGFNLKAQFVVLLLPAWIAATLAWMQRANGQRGSLLAAALLFLGSAPSLVGRGASEVLLAYGSMTLGTLLLAAVLVRQRFMPSPSATPAAGR